MEDDDHLLQDTSRAAREEAALPGAIRLPPQPDAVPGALDLAADDPGAPDPAVAGPDAVDPAVDAPAVDVTHQYIPSGVVSTPT